MKLDDRSVIQRVVNSLSDKMAALGALSIAVMAILTTYNVLLRLASGPLIPGLVDIGALVLVIVAFGGAAQAEVTETHVRMSMLADKVGARSRRLILASAQLVISVFVIVMIWASSERAWQSYLIQEVQSGQDFVPIWPMRIFIVLGLIVLLTVNLVKVFNAITATNEELLETREAPTGVE